MLNAQQFTTKPFSDGSIYRFLAKDLESRINMLKKIYFEAQLLISFLGEGSPDPVSKF